MTPSPGYTSFMLSDIEYAALGFETFHDDVLAPRIVEKSIPLEVEVHQCSEHLSPEEALGRTYVSVEKGWRWGPVWSSAWFRLRGEISDELRESTLDLHFSCGTEALLWMDGVPHHGFDPYHHHAEMTAGMLDGSVDFLIEAACNRPLGASLFWWEHAEEHGRWNEDAPGRLEVAALEVRNRDIERFCSAWMFGVRMLRTTEARDSLGHRIEFGMREIKKAILHEGDAFDVTARAADLEKVLSDGDKTRSKCCTIGHAHIDTAWLWPISETKRKCLRTFATQLRNLERFDDFRFLCSQPQQYAWMEEKSPDLFAQISSRVKEGRWEPFGAMWIEPDANIPSGESLIRQILHGTRYFEDRFGGSAPQEALYLPDTFGFPASLPQICRLAGLDTFITNKIAWCETNRFPHVTFDWRGIDGTEVLTHFTPGHNYNSSIDPQDFIDAEHRLNESDGARGGSWLQPYGWGDGGGGPDQRQIMNSELAKTTAGLPEIQRRSATEFCRTLHAESEPGSRPVWDGELYLELHRGTYTTHARLKAANRQAERALREIEALGLLLDSNVASEQAWLDGAWKTVLLNQFHDILPGSSIEEVYEDAHEALDHLHSESIARINDGLRDLAPAFDVGEAERPLLMWNPSSTGGSAVVETDAGPRFVRDIPAMGFRIIDLAQNDSPDHPVASTQRTLDNGRVKITLDEAGRVSKMDVAGEPYSIAEPLNTLVLHADRPRRWQAWDLDRDYDDHRDEQSSPADSIRLVEDSPLRGVIETRRSLGRSSSILQRYVLEADSEVLKIETRLDWQENDTILRAEFSPRIRSRHATYGIQFGSLERPTHRNTSHERAAFEVPGHLWMDLSQPGKGLAVLDDGSRLGRSCHDMTLGLSLVRSTDFPDPNADRGIHEFVYAIMPHHGDWRKADVDGAADRLGMPVRSTPACAGSRGPIKNGHALVPGLEFTDGIEIAALKRAEEGSGTIVRLVEKRGAERTVIVDLSSHGSAACEVDLLENAIDREKHSRDHLIPFTPYQIRSILVT